MPRIIRTRNMSIAPQANRKKRITRGDILRPQATKKHLLKVGMTTSRYKQILPSSGMAMRRYKIRAKTGMAANRYEQIQVDTGRSETPERPEIRPPPPSNPERHRSTNPPPGAAWQLVAANSNERPNRQVRDGATNQTRQVRDGGPERSERSQRPESPKNLNARANPNPSGPQSTCSHPITKTSSRRYQPYPWEQGRLYSYTGDNQTMQRKKGCRRKKGCTSTKIVCTFK